MFLFKTVASLQSHLEKKGGLGSPIGFVPTMGALHDGHAALIDHSIEEGYYTIVSIYVNPTQFNQSKDLEKYPRPIARDIELLYDLGCDVLFLPGDDEIYPEGVKNIPNIDLGHLNSTLEAAFRPGHFEGVLQVVHRLLEIVKPDYLFMGRKDLQQLTIIRQLISETGIACQLVGMPIVREPNGLARSSRNEQLSAENRKKASLIYKTLKDTADHFHFLSIPELKKEAFNKLNQEPFRSEYFEFVRTDNLKILQSKEEYAGSVSAVTAVWCDDTRLIDNLVVSLVHSY